MPGWPVGASAAGIVGERNESVNAQPADEARQVGERRSEGSPDGWRDLTSNQLTAGRALSRAEALAACGPAAAVTLARAAGRTWRRVVDASGTKAWIVEELLRPVAASLR